MKPLRTSAHPDGRKWQVRQQGVAIVLEIVTSDGEPLARSRRYGDGDTVAAAVAELIAEQLADGFIETSTEWRRFLDELVQYWRQDAPEFDAERLRDQILSSDSAHELIQAVMDLADYRVESDESAVLQNETTSTDRAGTWLKRQLPRSMPALVLALRHPDHGAQVRIEALIGEARVFDALRTWLHTSAVAPSTCRPGP